MPDLPSVEQKGTEHRDEITPEGFLSNNAGGILGGISSGQDIVAHIALKADLQHPPAGSFGESGRRASRGRHPWPPRPLCGHPRHADRRGHVGHRADGSPAAASRTESGRALTDADHSRPT